MTISAIVRKARKSWGCQCGHMIQPGARYLRAYGAAHTGEPPFTGPTAESVIHQHMTAEAPAITSIRPAVPAEVAGVIQRAMAKTPADRFSPAAQFAEALVAPGQAPGSDLPGIDPLVAEIANQVGSGAALVERDTLEQ